MKLFINIVMKRIYLFHTAGWNYRKKIEFPVCKKENFAGLRAHRKRGKSARVSPTPHHTSLEERTHRPTLIRPTFHSIILSRILNEAGSWSCRAYEIATCRLGLRAFSCHPQLLLWFFSYIYFFFVTDDLWFTVCFGVVYQTKYKTGMTKQCTESL